MKNKYTIKYWVLTVLLAVISITSYAQQTPTTDLSTHEPTTVPLGAEFEWREGAMPTSSLVSTPDAVAPGLYYGFYNYGDDCFSQGAPIRIITNICPLTTIDLNTAVDDNQPAGSVLSFHNALPISEANEITGTDITEAVTGATYYLAFKTEDANGSACYSEGSPIVAVTTDCTPNTTDAIDDINNTLANTPVPGNVLTNDEDEQGDAQTVTANTDPSNGDVVVNPDGSYVYTPDTGFTGEDSFTYTICDDGTPQACDEANVIIEVLPSNDPDNNPPVANNDTQTTEVDEPVVIDILPNDFDQDGDDITVTPSSLSDPANGDVVLNPDGTVTYTPDPGFEGEDTFTYEICDNGNPVLCDEATVTVTITPELLENVTYANDDAYTGTIDTPIQGSVLDNDEDPEGDNQTVNTTPVVAPEHGTVVLNSDGTFVYTPDAGYTGPDSYVYSLCDDGTPQACDEATVILTITPDNSTDAIDDINNTLVNTPVPGNVLTNDEDEQGDNQTVTGNTDPSNGDVIVGSNGDYLYTPDPGFTGEDSFTYTICDDGTPQACDEANVVIEVLPSNDPDNNPPVANNDTQTTEVDEPVVIDILPNDFDQDGDDITVTPSSLSDPANGDVVLNPDGTVTYTPDPGFEGEDTFTYEICDNGNPVLCDEATVTVTITPELLENVTYANDDAYTGTIDTPIPGSILDNDEDPEADNQTVNTTPVVDPEHGTVVLNSDGTFVYTPDAGYTGPDSYVYSLCDDGTPQACDEATVILTITTPDNTTNAMDDINNTLVNTPVSGNVLTNDFDDQGDELTVTANTDPSNGNVVINPDGSYVYTPDNDYTGEDSFTYTICDDGTPQACDEATVIITITPDNSTDAIDDINNTLVNTPVPGNVLTNDEDEQGDAQTVTANTDPSNGDVVVNPDGSYVYTPDTDFTGEDSFTYTICDNGTPQACDEANVVIEVLPSNDLDNNPPVANNDTQTTEVDEPVVIDILPNDFDQDGDDITVTPSSLSDPANGDVVLNPDGTVTYTPDPGFEGEDTFTYEICDNGNPVLCDEATVTVTITPELPENVTYANDDAYNGEFNTPISGSVLDNDEDPEGDDQTVNTTPIVDPEHGTVVLNEDGTFVYTPDAGYTGPDSYVYSLCDDGTPQACDEATVILTINEGPEDPCDVNASGYLTADCDGDGVPNGDELTPPNGEAPTDPTNPCDFIISDITLTPSAAFLADDCDNDGVPNGDELTPPDGEAPTDPLDPCDFIVSDITLTPSSAFLADDCDNDGVPNGNELTPPNGETPTNPQDPCDFVTADITLTPDATFLADDCDGDGVTNGDELTPPNGEAPTDPQDPCDFIASDITVQVTANEICNTTIANNDQYIGQLNTPVTGNVLDNDEDLEGNDQIVNPTPVQQPLNGSVVLNPNGTFVYTPNPGFTGNDVFVYELCDDGTPVACDEATVSLAINGPDDPCDANSASYLTADCDGDGVPNGNELTPPNGEAPTDPNNPCDFIVSDITLTPSAAFLADDCDNDGVPNGDELTPPDGEAPTDPLDPCDFIISDITLTPSAAFLADDCDNDGVPNGDELTPPDGEAPTDPLDPCDFIVSDITLTPSAAFLADDCDNDGVTNGDELTPPNGETPTNPQDPCDFVTADITLTPDATFLADDCDGDGVTNGDELTPPNGEAPTDPQDPCDFIASDITVQVTANEICNTTVANNDQYTGDQDTPISGNVTDNDTDPEGNDQFVNTTPVQQPFNGSVVLNEDGTFVYTPNPGFTGNDSFVYEVCDNGTPVACDEATVTLDVNDVDPGGCNAEIVVNGNTITVNNISAPIASVKVFDSSWGLLSECTPWSGAGCGNSFSYTVPATGSYIVQVQTYLDWNTQVCNLQEVVEVPGGNPLDCPSLNANFGDSCDDGNPNTTNDIVQFDCTCAGTIANTPSASINDLTVNEDAGTATVTVTLDQPALAGGFTVNYTTMQGTATSGTDFTPVSGSVTIPAGQTSATIIVPILEDTEVEQDETLNVTISAPTNGTISDPQGTITIIDNDVDPGGCNAEIVVNGNTITVNNISAPIASVKVFDSSWGLLSECTPWSGAGCGNSFSYTAPATGSYIVQVQTYLDWNTLVCNLLETVQVTGGGSTPSASINDVTVNEDAGTATVTVSLDQPALAGGFTVNYTTMQGTATSGTDFTPVSGSVTIPAGQTSATIIVPILEDTEVEQDETLNVTISAPTNGTISDPQGTITIIDNDVDPGGCNAEIVVNGNTITVNNISAPIASVKVFDSSWSVLSECTPWSGAGCGNSFSYTAPATGSYIVQVQTYLDWNTLVCNLLETVQVTGGGSVDCPSLNANFGDTCDDGNPNTINDVVMMDCSCAGTPVQTGCDNVTDGGLISGNETLCPGEDAGLIYSDVEPSGGTGDIEYIWLSSTTGCPTSISQIVPHAQSATFDPGELTVTTYYIRCSRRSSCPSDDAWVVGESNCIVKTVEDNGNCGSTGCPPAGTTCDDNNVNTIDDVEDGNCNCAGIPINTGGCTNTTNVALNGIASQSSTITAAGITGSAAKAIDGNTNGVFFTGSSSTSSVSATQNTTQPYWEVELDATYLIEQINVYNRTDGSDQSNNVYVLVSNTPFTATDLAGARAEADFEEFIPGLVGAPSAVSPNIEGKYVRIQMQGSGYLVLAEVEVMGCSNSTFNFAIPNMLFFNAEKDGLNAELSWMMMRDVAVDFYEVEVSTDGTNFRLLGDTNSDRINAPREYNITDYEPVYGENFYRLKVNNLDGTSFYSGVRRLTFNIDFDQVILYPNPTDKIINVTLRDFAGKSGTIEIYNNLGQKMAGREYLSFPTIPASFNVEDFVNGVYTISIKVENNKRFTKRFVVTKL